MKLYDFVELKEPSQRLVSGRRRETPVRGAGYEPEMSSSQSQVFSR